MKSYYSYSEFLKNKYGEKVYKLPINLPLTCPNRDGTKGVGGCIFCSDIAAGFEAHSHHLSVKEQIYLNKELIAKKYKAKKYIAFFQNYTNTYMPLEQFKAYINACVGSDIVAVAISTRPDCISEEQLLFLQEFREKNSTEIIIELGLQSVNNHTLQIINRGHSVEDFIEAVHQINHYPFEIAVHLILNLPWDTNEDIIKAAKLLSKLKISSVKLHSLYILKDTPIAKMFLNNEITLISIEEYFARCALFLEYLDKNIAIERFFARAPKRLTLFENWGRSWRYLMNELEKYFEEHNIIQGSKK